VEVGDVLATGCELPGESDGTILRRVTVSDELLLERLERHRHRALRACQSLLDQRRSSAALIDVEHLLDGSLYFYFLGGHTAELELVTSELADVYDTQVQFRRFAETLASGCGPDCGTEHAAGQGCGTGGCASCAVSGACGVRKGTA
jgi:hypothetical protein